MNIQNKSYQKPISLGRLATNTASVSRDYSEDIDLWFARMAQADKNKTNFSVSKKAFNDKSYYTNTQRPGSLKTHQLKNRKEPDCVAHLSRAFRGMLPKNKNRKEIVKNILY